MGWPDFRGSDLSLADIKVVIGRTTKEISVTYTGRYRKLTDRDSWHSKFTY